MKTLYILFIGLLVSGGVLAQSCLPEGITFSTQEQIDNFQINYPNCTEIEGNVRISGYEITSLSGLGVLTSFGARLEICWTSNLLSLSGLENVTAIGGTIAIYGNNTLPNLTGLEKVTIVEGYLFIDDNSALTNLTGLENVTLIQNGLDIWNNEALTSLSGLESVTAVGYLNIRNNDALTNLAELEYMTFIGGGLILYNNDALTSLTGLENVTSIEGTLGIYFNSALNNLTGLDNINAESIANLSIFENHLLSACAILSICDYLSNPNGFTDVFSNAIGCISPEEVQDSCEANAVDIDEQFIKDKLTIYPNPTSTQITIELLHTPSKITFLSIYNHNGQQLFSHQITEPQTVVDVSSLPSGIYFVKVMDDEKVMMGKVVKE